jgi:hypothetical protein
VRQARLDYLLCDSNSSGFLNLPILLLSLFVFRFASERLSIQYVYERFILLFLLASRLAGAKVQLLFYLARKKYFIFEIKFLTLYSSF